MPRKPNPIVITAVERPLSDYLADYLRSGFCMKQIANSYNVVANGIEQLMTMLILVVGAYTVMNSTDFSRPKGSERKSKKSKEPGPI